MGRKAVIFGFWIAGYAAGLFLWLVRAPILQFIENFGVSADVGQALLAGLFGSTVMVMAVVLWGFLSSSK